MYGLKTGESFRCSRVASSWFQRAAPEVGRLLQIPAYCHSRILFSNYVTSIKPLLPAFVTGYQCPCLIGPRLLDAERRTLEAGQSDKLRREWSRSRFVTGLNPFRNCLYIILLQLWIQVCGFPKILIFFTHSEWVFLCVLESFWSWCFSNLFQTGEVETCSCTRVMESVQPWGSHSGFSWLHNWTSDRNLGFSRNWLDRAGFHSYCRRISVTRGWGSG